MGRKSPWTNGVIRIRFENGGCEDFPLDECGRLRRKFQRQKRRRMCLPSDASASPDEPQVVVESEPTPVTNTDPLKFVRFILLSEAPRCEDPWS